MLTIEQAKQIFSNDRFATKQADIIIEEISQDNAVCSMQIESHHLNANNTVMGGAIFTLADFCFAVAANTGDYLTVSIQSSITFLRAATQGCLYAKTTPLKIGKSVCFYRIDITDENGNMIAEVNITGSRRAVTK